MLTNAARGVLERELTAPRDGVYRTRGAANFRVRA